jgi:hypothetical protein
MISLTEPGHFVVGCNYWASHAGTAMWSDWRPDVVQADLRQLAEAGLQVLRVFPLWPDFQPLTLLRTGAGRPAEFRFGESPLPHTEAGRAGVSEVAMAHFQTFADLAEQSGLKLVVGLLTGWMSGRLFVPPALDPLNVLTDPLAIQWEVRFVRYFVRHFRDHPAVLAWDLGNECNCMAPVTHASQAWAWTSAITNAIRVEDASRPVVSGMHSLHPQRDAVWRMQDQGELTDLLTTHPYPIFTPHCDLDPINTMRSGLHAVAESRLYGDIGDQPCLAEELGTLGPMISSEQVAADYVRMVLLALWAHDCHGLLWWCGYDQYHLEHAPYDWHSYERELGLFRLDRSAKPVTAAIGAFRAWLDSLPLASLPSRLTEAVCILSHGQDQWANALASFVLAKQAGFDLTFQYVDQPLRPAQLYLLPGLRAGESYTRRFWLELEARVRAGATLYVSHDDCLLSPFAEPFGLQVETRSRRAEPAHLRLASHPEAELVLPAPFRLALTATRAEVLGAEPDGNPLWTRARLGQGTTWFLGLPLERLCAETPGALTGAGPYHWVYRDLIAGHLGQRALRQSDPTIGTTEHPLNDQERLVVLINYGPQAAETTCQLAEGWSVAATWYGQEPVAAEGRVHSTLVANDGLVLLLKR